jgi:hypothetical protein
MQIDEVALQQGKRDAEVDIAASQCRLFWQTRNPWEKFWMDLLRERFGVTIVDISCITSSAKYSYERGYNQTIVLHINGTFGEGAFEKAHDELQDFRAKLYERWKNEVAQ